MEPLLMGLIGLVGGVVLAVLIAVVPRRSARLIVSRRLAAPSPAVINMAAIRVEGIGGLGMVAAVILVAAAQPHIRFAVALSFVLGVGLAIILIKVRRGTGGMPSSGGGPDDRSVLHLAGRRHSVERPGTDDRGLLRWHAARP